MGEIMTSSSLSLRLRRPSPTATLSWVDHEQVGSQPKLEVSGPLHFQAERSSEVTVDATMRNDDIVLPAFPHHSSDINGRVHLSEHDELHGSSRVRYDLKALISTCSIHIDLLLSKYIESYTRLKLTEGMRDAITEYESRLEWLTEAGAEDDIGLNQLSKRDFFSFIDSEQYLNVASLVLLDNGNIRALWKPGDQNQIGIQFRGNGKASYVIFGRISEDDVSRTVGLTSLAGLRTQIQKFGFEEELRKWPSSI